MITGLMNITMNGLANNMITGLARYFSSFTLSYASSAFS
jgi:ribosomal protein L6P/L9E